MGVSIWWEKIDPERHFITPGWRSMMHQLLSDNRLLGQLSKDDIPALKHVALTQMKGEKDPPFDYSDEIHKAFWVLIRAIRKHGSIVVAAEF